MEQPKRSELPPEIACCLDAVSITGEKDYFSLPLTGMHSSGQLHSIVEVKGRKSCSCTGAFAVRIEGWYWTNPLSCSTEGAWYGMPGQPSDDGREHHGTSDRHPTCRPCPCHVQISVKNSQFSVQPNTFTITRDACESQDETPRACTPRNPQGLRLHTGTGAGINYALA